MPIVAGLAWTVVLATAWAVFGGGRGAPCLGGVGTFDACSAAWWAAHPPPPPLLDITQPWPWLGIYVIGLLAIVAVGRARVSR